MLLVQALDGAAPVVNADTDEGDARFTGEPLLPDNDGAVPVVGFPVRDNEQDTVTFLAGREGLQGELNAVTHGRTPRSLDLREPPKAVTHGFVPPLEHVNVHALGAVVRTGRVNLLVGLGTVVVVTVAEANREHRTPYLVKGGADSDQRTRRLGLAAAHGTALVNDHGHGNAHLVPPHGAGVGTGRGNARQHLDPSIGQPTLGQALAPPHPVHDTGLLGLQKLVAETGAEERNLTAHALLQFHSRLTGFRPRANEGHTVIGRAERVPQGFLGPYGAVLGLLLGPDSFREGVGKVFQPRLVAAFHCGYQVLCELLRVEALVVAARAAAAGTLAARFGVGRLARRIGLALARRCVGGLTRGLAALPVVGAVAVLLVVGVVPVVGAVAVALAVLVVAGGRDEGQVGVGAREREAQLHHIVGEVHGLISCEEYGGQGSSETPCPHFY